MAVEFVDRARLAEMLDTECADAMPRHAAESGEAFGMGVADRDETGIARKGRE